MTTAIARVRFLDRRTPPHLFTLVAMASLAALNMNIFLPSLPRMAVDFDADYAVVQLTVSGYLATTAVLQLLIGPLSDRYGRRAVMLWALLLFLLATLACAFAPTLELFLAARMMQAAVVCGLVLSRAVVRDMHGATGSASMIGYVTMGMALAPMVGPMLGGLIDESHGWRTTFLVLCGFGVLVSALVWADLGETNLNRSASLGAQMRGYPELFRSRRFWGYAMVAASVSGAFFAFLGGGPYVASNVLGLAPSELGLYFGFIALGYMMGNFGAARLTPRFGLNPMMLTGALVAMSGTGLGIGLFALEIRTPLSFFGPILLVGLGNGLALPSANAGLLSVRPHLAGSASGLGGALMIGGGAGLAALAGALLGPDRGAAPLQWLMLAASATGMLAALYVIHVARSEALRRVLAARREA